MSPARTPGKTALVVTLAAVCVFALDQASKMWALQNLQLTVMTPFIPHLIGFTLVTNTGTAFGMWRSQKLIGMLLPPLICVAIVAYIVYREKKGNPLTQMERLGFGLILGGACGNVVDRFVRGQVTDFLYFVFWPSFPVFNIADALIDVGVAFILLQSIGISRTADGASPHE